jgi:hemoglobin
MENRNKWPEHLEKCTAFGKRFCSRNTPPGSPFLHINNYRSKEHFDRWMEIFTSTTDELFAGATEEAKLRAKNMAEMFNYKINYFKCWTNGDLLNLK